MTKSQLRNPNPTLAALLQQVETLTTRWAELAEAAEGAA